MIDPLQSSTPEATESPFTLHSVPGKVQRLSVVVPVYNERANLQPLYDELVPVLENIGEPFELIFVNDGSTDGSGEVLRSMRATDERVRVLTFDRNTGQTAALAAGFRASRGQVVLSLDADRQNDPKDIPALLAALDGHDAAVGWRVRRVDSWTRRATSRLANAIRNTLSGDDIIDTGCTLKAYRREALSQIKFYKGMHRFLPTLLRLEGLSVCQVEVGHRPRLSGASKYSIRNRALRTFADLLAVMWMKRRTIRYRVTEED